MTHGIEDAQFVKIWVACADGFLYNVTVPQPPAVVPGQGTQLEMPDIPKVKPKLKVKSKKPNEEVSKEKTKRQKARKAKAKAKKTPTCHLKPGTGASGKTIIHLDDRNLGNRNLDG